MSDVNHVIGWLVDRDAREALLQAFRPRYDDALADHITLESHVDPETDPPPPATCEIIARADDGEGVEAMVVRVNGSTSRPGAGIYHITWSLDRARGRKAVESNDVIRQGRWEHVPPHPVIVHPARFTSKGGG